MGVGLAINAATSALFLTFITLDLPWVALLCGYAPSIPYNVVAVVGVWRSAGHYNGPAIHAEAARIVTIAVMLLLTVT